MKERENRESWIRANDRPSCDGYQLISLFIFVFPLPGAVLALVQAPQDRIYLKKQQQDVFLLYKNSCQGAIPLDPLRSVERNHGEATVGRRGA